MATIGDVIDGKYELNRQIGKGGMSAVFEARHMLTETRVALKLLTPEVTVTGAKRFKLEVSVGSIIRHDGIVKVLDAGLDAPHRLFYIAMELLEGESLYDRLNRRSTTCGEATRLILDAIKAVAAAHEKGVVHRDLKPENLFVERTAKGTERVKVLDFGIARRLDRPSATATGTGVGTAYYMSPEQARNAKDVRASTDVWALGAILYEALTGKVPFEGDNAHAVVVKAVTEAHLPVAEARPDVPWPIADLVEWCLRKNPAERPPDAASLQEELENALKEPGVEEILNQLRVRSANYSREATLSADDPNLLPGVAAGITDVMNASSMANFMRSTPSSAHRFAFVSSRFAASAVVLVLLLLAGTLAFALKVQGGEDGGEAELHPVGTEPSAMVTPEPVPVGNQTAVARTEETPGSAATDPAATDLEGALANVPAERVQKVPDPSAARERRRARQDARRRSATAEATAMEPAEAGAVVPQPNPETRMRAAKRPVLQDVGAFDLSASSGR